AAEVLPDLQPALPSDMIGIPGLLIGLEFSVGRTRG
nr:hypothetical protein [Tanacetum cinerariifolium]